MIAHNICVGSAGLWIRIVNELILPNKELFLRTIIDSNFSTRTEAITLFEAVIKSASADMAEEFVSAGLIKYCAHLLQMIQMQVVD